MSGFESRESWLREATGLLRPLFSGLGFPIPELVRFSIGFPSTGSRGKRVGECWSSLASADRYFEIFIRADFSEPNDVLGILAHELVHTAVPLGSAHGPAFRKAALAIGLEGKMTATMPGNVLNARLSAIAAELGALPHGRLDLNALAEDRPKKQTSRLIKAECTECGYTVRVTRKWLDSVGAPHCPQHGEMTVAGAETEEN